MSHPHARAAPRKSWRRFHIPAASSPCRSMCRGSPNTNLIYPSEAQTSMSFDYTSVQYRSLQSRSVVITGGASGIGEEIVRAFVTQGARVSFIDIAKDVGETLASATGATFHACD